MLRTAIVSTYAPRHCGIATFTTDLVRAVGRCEIVALQPPDQVEKNPPEVHRVIQRDVRADHVEAARWVNRCGASVVSVQHDTGIWGGEDDSHVLDFVGAVTLPVVTTLHTLLREPSATQMGVMQGLLRQTQATVVMSQAAAAAVTDIYGPDPARVPLIPPGVAA
ncbi:MAG: glycosyltransferase, partial [Chloroflexi bacterium]|nr:glycosyltransferase [Chloroflexota bacterium]